MTPPRPAPLQVSIIGKFDEDTEPVQYFGNLFITNALLDSLIHMVLAEEIAGESWLDVATDGEILGAGGSTTGFRFPESYGKFPISIIFANPQ